MIEISWQMSDIVQNKILKTGEMNGSRIFGNIQKVEALRRFRRLRNIALASRRLYDQIELSSSTEWQAQPDSVREVLAEMLKNNLRTEVIATEIPQFFTWAGYK